MRFATVLLFSIAVRYAAAQSRPVVFVSIPPQAWLARRLAGEEVEVQTLLTPGANLHTYEPDARQIKKLSGAALYLTLGIPFEVTLAQRAARLNPGIRVAAMDKGIAKTGAHDHDHTGAQCCAGGADPHIWLSPRLMAAMASNTVEALCAVFARAPDVYEERLRATVSEITAVDAAVRKTLQGLKTRTWVAYHPSWSYFAADYGLRLLVIEQDGKSPSARHLAGIIRESGLAGVGKVFTEPQYDRRPAETLARQIGAALLAIDPLREDWPALLLEVAAGLAD
ncbi:MAG: zinc ABC transporter substrate-binding protein [Kiritimatiellae bacterium]|nr:zinc ABC transporter substrate-binding protein [Kiritimatiellia bacterium]MDD3545812.1 zinc ABC transporter substrate-binding protein [Kiritimatiellia bacterium]MDD4025811.1 zinc ABC transporter substrate-binding protein [Kiritimatiellia bacterium]